MRGWRAWARPHGDSAVRRLCESLSVLSTGAADTVRRRGECVDGALGRARTAIPPCVACVNLCSLPHGGYRQTERGVRGWRAWARPHGDSAVRPLCESLFSTARRIPSDGEGSAWLARLGAPARRFRRASPVCESHSTLYRTAILPCSTEAHCKVSTHYFLPSPPYSLQKNIRGPFVSIRGSPLFSLLPAHHFVVSFHSGDARRNRRAGAPKRANHALLSPLSSLLPTLA